MSLYLSHLTIGYPTKTIASDINAELPEGELTCLLGPNGVGKSTLLRTVAGFLPPVSGDILLCRDGMSRPLWADKREAARLLSVVLTHHGDLQNMTVRELVAMGRSPYTNFWGRLSKDDDIIVERAMNDVGMGEFADRQVMTLSDGECQKAMIAKALAQQTPIILLDEPTAFLDFPSKVETMLLLRRLCKDQGKTVILSTHDVGVALQMADKIWLYEKTAASACATLTMGTPRELADEGSIARFLGNDNIDFDTQTLAIRINTYQHNEHT